MSAITLSGLIKEISKEIPEDYLQRGEFLKDLQNVLEQDALRDPKETYNVGFEHLKVTITKYIQVPALDWQKRIFNLVSALNK